MKHFNLKNFSTLLLFICISLSSLAQTYVHGYYRKDGTYVHGYTRKSTNSTSTYSKPGYSGSTTKPHYYSSSTYGTVKRDSDGKIIRSASAKYQFMKQTGYPNGRPGYVVDHIVPLYKGGCDCPSNMQWQTKEQAKQKDKWE